MSRGLYLSTLALMLFSLISVYSLSIFTTFYFNVPTYHFLLRDIVSVILAAALMGIIANLNPDKYFLVIGFSLFVLSFAAIIAMLFLPETYVRAVLGAKRWIKLGPLSIAPTEFFKYGFLFFIAWSFERKQQVFANAKTLIDEFMAVAPYFVILAIVVLIIAVGQKDLGQVVVIAFTTLALLFLSGRSSKFFTTLIVSTVGLVILLIISAPHRINRFKGWWVGVQDSILSLLPNSIADSMRVTDTAEPLYSLYTALAMKSGGLFGRGLGEGQYKLGFLSEVHTDFIIAGLSEEVGVLGIIVILSIYAYIIFSIIQIGSKLKVLKERYFTYGVAITIFLSLAINLYGITGIIPIKGIAVPLLSYGGSQLIATAMAIGVVLMLSKKVEE